MRRPTPSHLAAATLRKTMSCGTPQQVAPGVLRILAANPKDYTGPGTNTYIVGDEALWIIDPGPDETRHIDTVLRAIGGRPVEGIFVTHTHLDHSPAARALSAATGADILGMGPLPDLMIEATNEDIDPDFQADRLVRDGDRFRLGDRHLRIVHTPGHFPNHLCLFLEEDGFLFSGDHVMGWSTTVIVPPLGHLGDYLQSLDKLDRLGAGLMLPSHGETVSDPAGRIEEIRQHRIMRDEQIRAALERGLSDPADIVTDIYDDLPPRLVQAARGQVQAHLDLINDEASLLRRTG